MEDSLGSGSIQGPAELQRDVLYQVARDLDLADIRRMPLWRDVVVLKDACGVEEMHERCHRFTRLLGGVCDSIPSCGVA